jgi:DNA-directed RNA polymerase subunit omega
MAVARAEAGVAEAAADGEEGAGIDSRFRLITVAALRSKQLQRGARPRIEVDPHRRRSTSIALEEVRRGLVPFKIVEAEP